MQGGKDDAEQDEDDPFDGLLRRVAAAPPVPLPSERRSTELPRVLAGRYRPVRFLAEGGMARVYEVEHLHTGERLALKLLSPALAVSVSMVERFKREARASARLQSQHVVRVKDADLAPELDGAPFLVMELLIGMDLGQAAASGPIEPTTVVDWLAQVAEAIDEAHGAGIVHRDLKPENLFLAHVASGPPVVKVVDFGIAKMLEETVAPTSMGQVLGTPKYMAPEQVARDTAVTPACDRFALGLIAYRLLAGEGYHRGSSMRALSELLQGALEAPSRRHPSFGAAFDGWFAQACHRDPGRRFRTAAEQVSALAAALGVPG